MINDVKQFSWSLGELARAAKTEVIGGGFPDTIEAVGTDSRSLPPGCLFVALRGERFDGHAFIEEAVRPKKWGFCVFRLLEETDGWILTDHLALVV